jgi:hypothetical protein
MSARPDIEGKRSNGAFRAGGWLQPSVSVAVDITDVTFS